MIIGVGLVTQRHIATQPCISQEPVQYELQRTNVSARRVPKLLGPYQKRAKRVMFKKKHAGFQKDLEEFIKEFATVDKSLVDHFEFSPR